MGLYNGVDRACDEECKKLSSQRLEVGREHTIDNSIKGLLHETKTREGREKVIVIAIFVESGLRGCGTLGYGAHTQQLRSVDESPISILIFSLCINAPEAWKRCAHD